MKIALITDTHWGIRNDALVMIEAQKKFLDTIFFPYLEDHNIDTVIHLGDLVDRRKYINFHTSMRMRKDFLDKLLDKDVHFIIGNHDVFYKTTNVVNCFGELGIYPYKVYIDPTEVTIGGASMLFLPWINETNNDKSMELLTKSKSQICMGHLSITGFEMERGHVATEGLSKTLFDKFDLVFSGHFHTKSNQGGIHYLGAPFEFTWGDYGSPKGFHILDTETRELEFIQNPYKLFHRLIYNDSKRSTFKNLVDSFGDLSKVTGSYVKIVVEQKTNPYFFDLFLQHIETLNPHDLKVVHQESLSIENDVIDSCEDTMTIVSKTIDQLEVTTDKVALKSLMEELHKSALLMEV